MGYLVIDEAEALTVIDVNTGNTLAPRILQRQFFKNAIWMAIQEIMTDPSRNLVLIVIDFIDMELQKHRSE